MTLPEMLLQQKGTSTVRVKIRALPSASTRVDWEPVLIPRSAGAPCSTFLTVASALVVLEMFRP